MLRVLIEGMLSLVPGHNRNSLIERRGQIRLRCRYPVLVTCGPRSFRSLVTDVGPAGLRLKYVDRLKKGVPVSVRLADGQAAPVDCKTVWCRSRRFSSDRVAGLAFTESPERLAGSWVHPLLSELGWTDVRPQRREWVRVAADLPVVLAGKADHRALLLDLGVGGALVQVDTELAGEFELKLGPWGELPGLVLPARVAGGHCDQLASVQYCRLAFAPLDDQAVRELGHYILKLLRDSLL